MQLIDVASARPPGSRAEQIVAEVVARRMRRVGLRPTRQAVRVPTSPTWAPLLRALLRVWSAAFLAAGWPLVTIGLAGLSVISGNRSVAGLVRFAPILGAQSVNIVAMRRGTDRSARPLVVFAHLDTHPTQGAPLRPIHRAVAALSGWAALLVGIAAGPGTGWRPVAAFVAGESVFTLAWLARQELATPADTPDDNTSGLFALVRLGELIVDGPHARAVALVATTAGTSGGYGARTFLSKNTVGDPWVVEIDALGAGEVVASPHAPRFPYPGTPSEVTKALTGAAQRLGDPLAVRRVVRAHSDALAALQRRTPAISLVGGLRPPRSATGPDPGNAERAARIIDMLARSTGEPKDATDT